MDLMPTTTDLRSILEANRTIAMVGASSNPSKPSYEIMKGLLAAGFTVIPVNPTETEVLGQKTKIEGREANRFATETSTRLVISEVNERKRWIELAVHHYSGDTLDVDRFLKSVEFSANSGIEIGDGVESVLGDPMPEVPATTKAFLNNGSSTAPAASVKSEPYRIISQPRAGYPDVTSCAQGAVRLKLTLLGSGAIGSIVVVTRLPDGLTESAIAAAKRIVFLPKRVNGIPVSSVITREYPFGIY